MVVITYRDYQHAAYGNVQTVPAHRRGRLVKVYPHSCSTCNIDYPDALLEPMEDVEGLHCPTCRTYTRTCTSCGITKPHHVVHFTTNGTKGLRSTCRVCHRQQILANVRNKRKKLLRDLYGESMRPVPDGNTKS